LKFQAGGGLFAFAATPSIERLPLSYGTLYVCHALHTANVARYAETAWLPIRYESDTRELPRGSMKERRAASEGWLTCFRRRFWDGYEERSVQRRENGAGHS